MDQPHRSSVRTDDRGGWSMRVKKVPAVLMFSAAAPGYVNAVDAVLFQEFREIHFVLDPVGTEDDPRYVFVDPTPDKPTRRKWTPKEGRKGFDLWRCGNCHRNSYDEWKISRHALAAENEVTRAVYERDFLPAVAAGKAEGDPGLCAACHAPQAALDGQSTPLSEVRGTALRGNHCDLCHKIHHIDDLEAPGAHGSLALRRPSPERTSVPGAIKRIFGTLADVDYRLMGPSYHPFFGTSALCAGCHQYTTPSGIPARHTYREWARWAGEQEEHRSCQSCHMRTGESREGKRPANRICINALRRPPEQIHHHGFVGRERTYEAVDVSAVARREGQNVIVTTKISTHDVGHKIPTGSSGKHLLVVIHAVGKKSRIYERVDGPQVPDHAGGDPDLSGLDTAGLYKRLENGDYAGFAGREFALVLADAEGNTHVPFWRAARVVENTRLLPDSKVEVRHAFRIPAGEQAVIRVELYHRLRFKATDVAGDVKGTGARPLDLLVAAATVAVK
jgi:mono/diheme cytochrome c family protein